MVLKTEFVGTRINKDVVKNVLIKRPGEFFTTKMVMNELQVFSKSEMRRVSRILYRLRANPNVERTRNSASYFYRYILKSPPKQPAFEVEVNCLEKQIEELKAEIKELKYRKSPTHSTAKNKITINIEEQQQYTYLEELEEPKYDTCELSGIVCELTYRAETSRGVELLCEECGAKVNEKLGGYGGAFQ